jgi:hypothetical protein
VAGDSASARQVKQETGTDANEFCGDNSIDIPFREHFVLLKDRYCGR